MSRFPKVTETFILREMLELERQGRQLLILPLISEREAVVHPEVEQIKSRVHYTPLFSWEILKANLTYLASTPALYLTTLWTVLTGNWRSSNLFLGALGVFPKSVYFAGLLAQSDVRHVHAHFATHPALSAFIISSLTGLPFSFTVHAHDIFVHSAMLREKLAGASFVVSISEFNKAYILERFPHVENKIRVVHCGIRPDEYEPVDHVPTEEFRLLSVASLQVYKGIEYLIRACGLLKEKIPGIRCTVIGEGTERAHLEALIASHGLERVVELVGAKPQAEVAAYLRRSNVFVLPSIVAPDGQMEGIPVALMEAMASRLPVVSTKISGIPELVQHGVSGLLVCPKDVEALAEAITELFDQPELRRQMGVEGSSTVRREFDLTTNVEKLKEFFTNSAAHRREDLVQEVSAVSKLLGGTLLSVAPATAGGADSRVMLATLRGPDRVENEVVIKFHSPGNRSNGSGNAQRLIHAENEYRALVQLWPAFQNLDGLGVPRPLGLDLDNAAVVTERCSGVRLDTLLREQRAWSFDTDRRLDAIFEATGRWLAKFQTVTRSDRGQDDVLLRLQNEFTDDVAACSSYFDRSLLGKAEEYFSRNYGALASDPGPVVSEHCDFGPHNVFVDRERITLIDFEGMRDGFVYADLMYFLCLIDMMPFHRATDRQKKRLQAAVLRGYERGSAHELVEEVLAFYMVPTLVKMAAHSPVLRSASTVDRLRRSRQLRMYTQRLKESIGGSRGN